MVGWISGPTRPIMPILIGTLLCYWRQIVLFFPIFIVPCHSLKRVLLFHLFIDVITSRKFLLCSSIRWISTCALHCTMSLTGESAPNLREVIVPLLSVNYASYSSYVFQLWSHRRDQQSPTVNLSYKLWNFSWITHYFPASLLVIPLCYLPSRL